jgi:hypothetical protein
VSAAKWQAGVLLLALMAAGSTDNAEVTVAEPFTGLGGRSGRASRSTVAPSPV